MRRIPILRLVFLILAFGFCAFCNSAKNNKTSLPAQAESQPAPAQEKPEIPVDAVHDDIAKFISGIPTSSPQLNVFQETDAWKNFAAFMESSWADLEKKRLKPMRDWAVSELSEADKNTKVLFYPFGGPDFLTAYLLFPNAETYVLLGLEFVGKLPTFETRTAPHVEAYLENVKWSLSDFFQKSYFITHDMDETLQDNKVDGILPLICLFLKKAGASIVEIKRLEFDDEGQLQEGPYETTKKKFRRPYGFRLAFMTNAASELKNIYYFSCDLADERFTKESKLYAWLEKMGRVTTYIKSASYLPHYRTFANIRNMILAQSAYILEDDTGVPYRYFTDKEWEVQLYGQYAKPVKDFAGVEQRDLKAAYKDKTRIKKLPFHLGYHWGSNLDAILYIKRKTPQAESR
jgi:hypothetical protein